MYRCNAGYTGPDGGTCTACAAGKYKVALGSADCSPCVGVYSHSPEASADSKFCGCNVGYTGPDGSTCTACEAGKYKVIIGKDVCFDCPAGKFKAGQGSGTCTHCQKGKYSAAEGAKANTTCEACPANSFSPAESAAASACI
eukprot:Tamp_13822.p2 GENE.Tamp_13822~~Tamp_13822.p2  ORF type:complete len:142 (+),score=21.29 Tamp_13822:1084-1509(+)